MSKLDPEFKVKWIAALLSGKYKQGIGQLRRDGKYCCLGVACDLIDPSKWVQLGWSEGGAESWGYRDKDTYVAGSMPLSVAKIIGLDNADQSTLAYLNDSSPDHGITFKEIADWIRDNL